MKKTIIALMLAVCMLCPVIGSAEAAPAEKAVPFFNEAGEAGELTLRFYEETPNIPYMGINEYMTRIMNIPLTAEAGENGTLLLKNELGGKLLCDAAAGTIITPDWVRVITPKMPIEGSARSLSDVSCAFVRISNVEYEGEPAPITFDFAKYGIKIHSDGEDVYLPISILSDMMTDIATNHLRYDGKNLYLQRVDLSLNPNDSILMNETMLARLKGEERPADIIAQCYADLCFTFDYFFGHPGKCPLDAALAEKGLDGAIDDLGAEGAAIKADLLSPSLATYLAAMQKLFLVYLSDGHTVATDISVIAGSEAMISDKVQSAKLTFESMKDMLDSKTTMQQILHLAITPQRKLAWGDDKYREYGSTAIIRLDTFMPDEEAWAKYYKGEGEFPQDCVGIVVSGLRKARENASIKNVILDLSCNGGGSSDVLMMILGLTTGQNQLYGKNILTGQSIRVTYESDNNFDGVFDEKDKEERFDFNYGVLTTRQAFSCGNLCPIIMREGGAVVIGEPTSGGGCCIQVGTDIQGIRFMMSSCQWQLVDSQGNSVEGGCTVDLPIGTKSIGLIDKLIGKLGIDEGMPVFTAYFDDVYLNTLMNAWFHVQEEVAPAA